MSQQTLVTLTPGTHATHTMASAIDTSQPDPLASPKLRKADDAELGLVRPTNRALDCWQPR